ncbi:hypothetical protein BpHYR1_046277 [Brachionus plicatilis]|uniref:Uncharacterized protein n=1 Tax=Brachionus plicatilis TaxID=10195 RepID=A0A3M7PXL9_BRAPC|nr:hypothetical protein BpHYR1_046277 [Brachionus plicatilis]
MFIYCNKHLGNRMLRNKNIIYVFNKNFFIINFRSYAISMKKSIIGNTVLVLWTRYLVIYEIINKNIDLIMFTNKNWHLLIEKIIKQVKIYCVNSAIPIHENRNFSKVTHIIKDLKIMGLDII